MRLIERHSAPLIRKSKGAVNCLEQKRGQAMLAACRTELVGSGQRIVGSRGDVEPVSCYFSCIGRGVGVLVVIPPPPLSGVV